MKDKKIAEIVKNFYDTYGWLRDDTTGQHHGETYCQDLDAAAQEYRYRREVSYRRYYGDEGGYFLDAGCGGEPRPRMSESFQKHLCLDISIMGLQHARQQLGDRGAYVLADLASLPFKDEAFDGVLASHCLYHVDKDLQPTVLLELHRVTRAEKNILVFYSSRNNLISWLHQVPKVVVPVINSLLRRIGLHLTEVRPYLRKITESQDRPYDSAPPLYSYPYSPAQLARPFKSADITCLMTLTRYDTELLRRLHLLRLVVPVLDLLERKFPHAMVYIGKFTCIRIQKTS